jgi:hypothetical protein
MNVKNFIIGGIVGGIVDFLLGWLFYGQLFTNLYPQNPNTKLEFIFLGCMTFGFFISLIFTKWAGIKNPITGLKAGALIGLFYGLSMNFFMYSSQAIDYKLFGIDTIVNLVMGAGVGAAVAFVLGKIK